MTKLGKSVLAATLAVIGFASVANAAEFRSYGKYYVNGSELSAPVVLEQPAVLQNSGCCPQTTIIEQPAVVETCPAVAPVVIQQPAVIDATNLCGASLTIAEPACRIIEQSAVIEGFSMDANTMKLYTGPRFENTLTMPRADVYLRN